MNFNINVLVPPNLYYNISYSECCIQIWASEDASIWVGCAIDVSQDQLESAKRKV
jgi:hypothetical protein